MRGQLSSLCEFTVLVIGLEPVLCGISYCNNATIGRS